MDQRPKTLCDAEVWATGQLATVGTDAPRRDARLLVAAAVDARPQDILMEGARPLSDDQWDTVQAYCQRRCQHEPVSRILGKRGFWTLDLTLNADTLDPRPETETLVEAVLEAEPNRQRPLRIIDFGTGSGCILLALLSEYPQASGIGLDIAPGAVEGARVNAQRNGLADRARFKVANWEIGNWADGVSAHFDILLANPPYIAENEMAGLAPEVTRYDPRRALVAGPSGFEAYESLLPQLPPLAAPGAMVALEGGRGQASTLVEMLKHIGCTPVWTKADLAGIARCISGFWPRLAEKGCGATLGKRAA